MSNQPTSYVRHAWVTGLIVLLVVALLDLTVHHHAHFERDGIEIDTMPEFFPLYGFGAALALVLVAKTLAIGLKRKDTYYADD